MANRICAWFFVFMAVVFSSCTNNKGGDLLTPAEKKLIVADSIARCSVFTFDRMVFWKGDERSMYILDSLMGIIDNMEKSGDLNEFIAEELRGELYDNAFLYTKAEECYNHVLAHEIPTDIQQWHYKTAGNQLAYRLYMRHNYEGFVRVAVPLSQWMTSLEETNWEEKVKQLPQMYNRGQYCTWAQKMNLYSLLGCCYLKLEQPDKAKEVLEQFDNIGRKALAEDSTRIAPMFVNTYARVKDAYVRIKDWEEVRRWMDCSDLWGYLYEQAEPKSPICKIYENYRHLDQAIRVWSLGDADSAAAEYARFENSANFNTLNGRIQSNDYLMNAERWEEAADNYEYLDYFVDKPWLEEISAYYFPKLRANYYAGRNDSALVVAMQIADLFDSAYVWQKKSQMAEMAVIYDTQGKEMQIAKQQAELSQQRLWGTGVALVLLTAFFLVYTLNRRRAQQRLSVAHQKLQTAYDQLEETTTAKERIESELRIARDIQMSMVPGVFPEHEGLDMYAEMNPAKEVGGDLYGYVLQGERLYFCLGDVSGKGVPASLFMAQSARLFRTLATEGLAPDQIAVRMNNELSENNDRGMFVTMFIGVLHLDTGRLDFCNCGHNAPVIDGRFLEMQYDNAPLGLWEDDPFIGESIEDIGGKQLLIYTDGLNEAENRQQQLLGNARLLELMANTKSLSSHEVIDMLKAAVEKHRDGADPNDDLTLMCIMLNV